MSVTTQFDEDKRRWAIHVSADRPARPFTPELETILAELGAGHVTPEAIELWIHDVDDASHAVALAHGFRANRDLWQLRCALPVEASTLPTRPFTPADADAFIAVNNRSFSWHPEQGGMTRAKLDEAMAEPWFDPDGFRLYERDGELVGFCWTKIHSDLEPVVGEIYVIAVDPSAHGQGLGGPMTLAGLDWIHAQGIDQAMLYVESDNDAANATYRKIGFRHHSTDRAYSLAVVEAPS